MVNEVPIGYYIYCPEAVRMNDVLINIQPSVIPICRHLQSGRMQRAGSRIWRCKRSNARSAPSDVAAASRRNLRRLIDSSRQIARCSSIDGYTRLHGKGELRRPRYVMLELRREYWRCTSILNRVRSLDVEFLSLFTLRRSTYCTLLSIVREFPP